MKLINDISWQKALSTELEEAYFKDLWQFVEEQYASKTIYPGKLDIFKALEETSLDNVKVVILGQDPYHGPFQANGLAFSVSKGVKAPPSLKNIFKELEDDLGVKNVLNGDLSHWAKQGVLLLNATLTVEQGKAGSHQKKGWERFTDKVIACVANQKEEVVFVLWGSYAQKKGMAIDRTKHFVLEAVHPSPLSVYRGFYGSKPFSAINKYLKSKGKLPIDWKV